MPGTRQQLKIYFLAMAWLALGVGPIQYAALAQVAPSTDPPGARPSVRNAVERVDYATLPAGRTLIRLIFRHDVQEQPRVLKSYHPAATLTLDFDGTVNASGKETIEVAQRELRSIQIVPSASRLRVILKLARPAPHEIEIQGRELLVTLLRPVASSER